MKNDTEQVDTYTLNETIERAGIRTLKVNGLWILDYYGNRMPLPHYHAEVRSRILDRFGVDIADFQKVGSQAAYKPTLKDIRLAYQCVALIPDRDYFTDDRSYQIVRLVRKKGIYNHLRVQAESNGGFLENLWELKQKSVEELMDKYMSPWKELKKSIKQVT